MLFSCNVLFQSNIAVTAFNIANMSGKVGAALAPMIAELPGIFPMVFYTICGVLSIFLVYNMRVPEMVEDKDIKISKKNL